MKKLGCGGGQNKHVSETKIRFSGTLDSGVSDKAGQGITSPLHLASAQLGKCPEPSGSGPSSAVSSSRSVQHPTALSMLLDTPERLKDSGIFRKVARGIHLCLRPHMWNHRRNPDWEFRILASGSVWFQESHLTSLDCFFSPTI